MSSYANISNFGSGTSAQSSPLATCAVSTLESGFNATLGSNSLVGPESSQCQLFMGSYCGRPGPNGWDGVCEYLSQDNSQWLPNSMGACNGPSGSCFSGGLGNSITKGQMLIRNSASERFLTAMSSNCQRDYEPFDPTVANSPLIGRWKPMTEGCGSMGNCNGDNTCVPIYSVDPNTIDNDVVMNKLLAQPWIALDILVNIYNNAVSSGNIRNLVGTKLGNFFKNPTFQGIVKSGMYRV